MARILVIGATGQQGGHVVDALLPLGHDVIGLARNASSESAQALADRGVTVVEGSLDSVDDIADAMAGADATFAMTTLMEGLDVEVQHGYNIVEAAERQSMPHLVYSSVASADQNTRIGHFDSKWDIERRLASSTVPSTVIAPTFFMDNYLFPWNLGDLAQGNLREAVAPGTKLQMVDARDIGLAVAAVIGKPDTFAGQRIEIVGDELDGDEIAAALSNAIGTPVAYEVQPLEELASMGDMARMYEWFNETGYHVDFDGLAAQLPNVRFRTLADWAGDQDWQALLG